MLQQDTPRRVPYGVWVEDAEGSIPSFYLAHSLTPSGLRLRAKHPPQTGRPLHMRLLVENERRVMTLQGQVICGDDSEQDAESFAVQFLEMDPFDRAFLNALIAESLEAAGPEL